MTEQEVAKNEKNIYEAIIAIMGEVGYVQKERTRGLSYSFAGEAALIQALRPSMVEHGVFMYVTDYEVTNIDNYLSKQGTEMQNVKLRATVNFTHAPSETSIAVAALGEGADSSDKATNKAMTGALKYAIRQTFLIETGDDPDKTREDRVPRAAAADENNEPAPAEEPRSRTAPQRPYLPADTKKAVFSIAHKAEPLETRSANTLESEIGKLLESVCPQGVDWTELVPAFFSFFGIDYGVVLGDLNKPDQEQRLKIMAALDEWLYTSDKEKAEFATKELKSVVKLLGAKVAQKNRPMP